MAARIVEHAGWDDHDAAMVDDLLAEGFEGNFAEPTREGNGPGLGRKPSEEGGGLGEEALSNVEVATNDGEVAVNDMVGGTEGDEG